ncbi:GNAT family N-acetyltransferase [Amycolatopsis ultiminotia]|uniref:GNAT family N-acetyltransferase n=1 Tax=Amycolatopsis ultiminotia TaxID=543629 RepID=A0ABP6VD79_9PSEU
MFASAVHAYVRAQMGTAAVHIGPFLASFDSHDDGLFRNYAIPGEHTVPTAGDVAALVRAFRERNRVPRLEYLPALQHGLEHVLTEAGFTVERHLPVMVCPTLPGPAEDPAGVEILLARSDRHLWQAAAAQNAAYGQAETTVHDKDRLRATLDRGGLVALALDRHTGAGVGAGLCAPPHHGVSELAAIGVRTTHRRRGIAAALTVLLTRSGPAAGITTPFLTPAGEAEERIYRSVGYRAAAQMIHISLPPDRGTLEP